MKVYLIRHGKTMFNTIDRTQGWSDSPLTKDGIKGIQELGLGFKVENVNFDRGYSSDSGRAIQTAGIVMKYSNNEGIPYKWDERIREWCFGSFDGGYNGELFGGVLPRVFAEEGINGDYQTYPQIAEAIMQVDTANWAEPWEKISGRIIDGFTSLAQEAEDDGAENIFIVSHGMTIATFLTLLRPDQPQEVNLENGSVTHLNFENGKFTIEKVGDMSYREIGRKELALL